MATVLIVEDDPMIRTLLCDQLQREFAMDMCAVTSGTDALHAIQMMEVILCLLDVNLPDMSGFMLCKKSVSSATSRSFF